MLGIGTGTEEAKSVDLGYRLDHNRHNLQQQQQHNINNH